ncbi:MAG TPA: hypothetical protein HA341_03885 [Halobacteria archaeon]|jgi:tRNA (guanine10-N2)-dimethyltransferase|nr:hypothetical protein [Halobacteria archaeon]
MKLLFELSGEDKILPRAEVFALFDEYKIILDFKTVLILNIKQNDYIMMDKRKFQYLGLTKYVSEMLAVAEANKEDIIRQVLDLKLELDEAYTNKTLSLCVRCKRVERSEKSDIKCLELEQIIGRIFKDKGFKIDLVDPDIEIRVILCRDKAIIGRKISSYEDYEGVPYGAMPFFHPGIIKPKYARVLVNLCALNEGERLLDPMCGTGYILIEGFLMGLEVIGSDIREDAVKGSVKNLNFVSCIKSDEFIHKNYEYRSYHFMRSDSRNLCFKDKTLDGVVVDMPYGRSSPIFGKGIKELYQKSLEEIYRVYRRRCVIVSKDNLSDIAESIGFKKIGYYEQRVHRSLTRKILVLA